MPIIIGTILAVAVAAFARWVGFDRDRAFYATIVIIVGSFYVLYAALGDNSALPVEIAISLVFTTLAVIGFKRASWLIPVALLAHGLLDMVHSHLVPNAGVPLVWPAFCAAYDVTAAAVLALIMLRPRPPRSPAGEASRRA